MQVIKKRYDGFKGTRGYIPINKIQVFTTSIHCDKNNNKFQLTSFIHKSQHIILLVEATLGSILSNIAYIGSKSVLL